ncbi:MAG: hypothetical protein AABY78_06685 [Nitrospirota bacterium]
MKISFRDIRPAADRRVLFIISGISWSIVGLMLCNTAIGWLDLNAKGFIFAFAGILVSLFAYHIGFSKIADRNIERISQMGEKVCIFAFQAWKSYILIAFMIGLGIFLRYLPINKYYLSVMYIGVGFSLFLSSIRYYRAFFFTRHRI